MTHPSRFTSVERGARVLALLVAVLVLTGCASLGAFGDDVELSYGADVQPAPAPFGEDLRALVLRRLSAAQIGADVTLDDRRVHIVVDSGDTARVDELVTWTGTLSFFEADDAYAVPPRDLGDLAARRGGWEGTYAELSRAVERWPVDSDHRVVLEPLWDRDNTYRARFVRKVPIAELGDGTRVGWGDRGALRLRAEPGSLAAAAIALARDRSPVLVRNRTSLGAPTFEDDAVLLKFGGGIEAYARGEKQKNLLTTPRLPSLHRADAVGLPPNRTLAGACIVLPILLSLAWLAFVRRFDRAHPEPRWLILVTFLLGVLSTLPAGLLEFGASRLSPWLDPRFMTFGGQVFALPISFVVMTLVVGLVEEGSKFAATMYAARRPEFDEPIDGIVYGIVASLGFAAAENVRYFALGRLTAPLVIARSFMSVPAHMFFGAIWGAALGRKLVDRRARVGLALVFAAAAHGLFDALLSTEGGGIAAIALNVSLASVFIFLIQRALRHGVIEKAMLSIAPHERALFRVGRPTLFWFSSVGLHVFAFGIFMLGAWYQLARRRPELPFIIGSSVFFFLLAVAALGVSATLPLDVAVDAYGVTFAGAARAWRKIRGFSAHVDRVELDCEGGPLTLGPADEATAKALALAIRAGLSGGSKTLDSVVDPPTSL